MPHLHLPQSRFLELAESLSTNCDAEFDCLYEDLEREFQELRFTIANQQMQVGV